MPFQPQKNLPGGAVFSAKDMQYSQAKDSKAMKQMTGNKKISGVLDKVEERKEFYKVLQEQAGGKGKSVKRDAVRKTLGIFRSGGGKSIDAGEAQKLGEEFSNVLNGKRYLTPKMEKEGPARDRLAFRQKMAESKKNSPVMNPRGGSSPIAKSGSSSGKDFVSRPRLF